MVTIHRKWDGERIVRIGSVVGKTGRGRGKWLRRFLPVVPVALAAGLLAPSSVRAFDCAKAYLAVDYVICADPALMAAVDRLQATWDALRPKLADDARKTLVAEQKQWIADYASRCGVPGRGKPTPQMIEGARACIAAELGHRRGYLAALDGNALAATTRATAPLAPPPAAPSKPPAKHDIEVEAATQRMLFDPADYVTIDPGPDGLKIVGKPPRIPDITGPGWQIYLSGPIDDDADRRFAAFMKRYRVPDRSLVSLHSPGGNVRAGLALGREFRKHALATYVARDTPDSLRSAPGECYSACSLAYLGGRFRYIDKGSAYGVHRFSFRKTSAADSDIAQVLSGQLVDYMTEMGIDAGLYALMTLAGNDDMLVLPKDDLERLKVINNGVLTTAWTLESIDVGLYVKGQRETIHGTDKVIFMCSSQKRIVFKPMFNSGLPENLLGGRTPRKLTIDRDVIDLAPYEAQPVQYENAYVTASYVLPPGIVAALPNAKRIGYAVLAPNPDLFYGFEMPIDGGGRQKLAGYIASCR